MTKTICSVENFKNANFSLWQALKCRALIFEKFKQSHKNMSESQKKLETYNKQNISELVKQ